MRLVLVTPPAVEPVTLSEVKLHLRLDSDFEDTLISTLITAARMVIEKYAAIMLIHQTWRYSFDLVNVSQKRIVFSLPFSPIQSINSITIYDDENNESTLNPTFYGLSGERVIFNDGFSFPSNLRPYDGVDITFIAGYGASSNNVPQPIKQALLMLVAHWYENREAVGDPLKNTQDALMPLGVSACLQPYRNYFL